MHRVKLDDITTDVGDLLADLAQHGGRIQGTEWEGGVATYVALIPDDPHAAEQCREIIKRAKRIND